MNDGPDVAASLTAGQLDQLLKFIGYGNPAGRFWFIGMEEQGKGAPLELAWRLPFNRIEDLIAAHERGNQGFRQRAIGRDAKLFVPTKLIPTWSIMSKLVLRLSGTADWEDLDGVRRYQATALGRRDGDSFRTEVLPLPAPNTGAGDWPCTAWFSRAAYCDQVLPARRAMLRDLFDQHRPAVVACYGKANWPEHRRLFPPAAFTTEDGGRYEIARVGQSTIVLTPSFATYRMTPPRIEEIARLIEAAHG
jgi:hypothetical protein